jgi:hypothetical protein
MSAQKQRDLIKKQLDLARKQLDIMAQCVHDLRKQLATLDCSSLTRKPSSRIVASETTSVILNMPKAIENTRFTYKTFRLELKKYKVNTRRILGITIKNPHIVELLVALPYRNNLVRRLLACGFSLVLPSTIPPRSLPPSPQNNTCPAPQAKPINNQNLYAYMRNLERLIGARDHARFDSIRKFYDTQVNEFIAAHPELQDFEKTLSKTAGNPYLASNAPMNPSSSSHKLGV